MPYKLIPPKKGRTPNWRVRGTLHGVPLDKSTQTADKALAEVFLSKCVAHAVEVAGIGTRISRPEVERVADAIREAERNLPPRCRRGRYLVMARAAIASISPGPNRDQWVAIPEFPDYQVSSAGSIRRVTADGRFFVLRPGRAATGHENVSIYRDRRQLRVGLHRLVCIAFNGPPPFPGAVARHLNGVPQDNRPENLAWGTPKENSDDARRHRGEIRAASVSRTPYAPQKSKSKQSLNGE